MKGKQTTLILGYVKMYVSLFLSKHLLVQCLTICLLLTKYIELSYMDVFPPEEMAISGIDTSGGGIET